MVESDWPMVNSSFFQGVYFFLQGAGLIFKPGLRRYIVIPIIFNAILLVIIFTGLAFFLYYYLHSFIAGYKPWVIVVFGWLFWILYSFISLLVSTLIFTILTNIIASPFYGLLAEAAAKLLIKEKEIQLSSQALQTSYANHPLIQDSSNTSNSNHSSNAGSSSNAGNAHTSGTSNSAKNLNNVDSADSVNNTNSDSNGWLKTALMIAPRTLAREGRKLLYFLPWVLLCGLFLIFPFTWPLLPFAWWAVLTWILAIQYIDYEPDNQQIHFKDVLRILKKSPLTILGFGSIVSLAMMIPGANLFVPPAAVAGGTALWLSLQSLKSK